MRICLSILLVVTQLLFTVYMAEAEQINNAPVEHPDLTSPESTVRSIVTAYNRMDLKQAAKCVAGAGADSLIQEREESIKADLAKGQTKFSATIDEIKAEAASNQASVALKATLEVSTKGQPTQAIKVADLLSLRRFGSAWKIIPPTDSENQNRQRVNCCDYYFSGLATELAHVQQIRQQNQRSRCMQYAKSIADAIIAAIKSSEDKFILQPDDFLKVVQRHPDVRLDLTSTMHCPADPSEENSYAFNENLYGIALNQLPIDTVFVYEGKEGVLHFRHDGKALVVYKSGVTHYVTEKEAKTLRWKPNL